MDGCTYISESSSLPKCAKMGGAFGAPTRLHWWNSAADLGDCVCGQVQQSVRAQLMPQEIPAIGHPYKVTFSIRTVIYRQIISTGSNTEHPACASHSGLNLLTYLLTHQCAVIISLPTHFTTPATSFLPYLSLDYTLLHVLKWVVRQCQQISTRITKYMHFILQLKVHKSIPDRTKPGLQWLNSRISLQLLTFVLAYSCLTDLSRTFSSVSTELLYMQPIFTQQMIRMALAICLFHTSQSPCCLPNCAKKRGHDVYGPVLWEHNQIINARQTNGVVPQTVTPKHTHGRVCSKTTTADCRQVLTAVCSFSKAFSVLVGPRSDSTGFVRILGVSYT